MKLSWLLHSISSLQKDKHIRVLIGNEASFSVTASHTKLVLKQGLAGQLDKKGDLGLPRNREISSKDPAGLNTQMVEHSDGAQGLQDTLSGFITPLGKPTREFKSTETSFQPSPCFPQKTEI